MFNIVNWKFQAYKAPFYFFSRSAIPYTVHLQKVFTVPICTTVICTYVQPCTIHRYLQYTIHSVNTTIPYCPALDPIYSKCTSMYRSTVQISYVCTVHTWIVRAYMYWPTGRVGTGDWWAVLSDDLFMTGGTNPPECESRGEHPPN